MSGTGGMIETDYLVVGAGTAGMTFTDALLTHSDATVTLVDRRHAPGGHWIDAYPFVKLHQPSAFYGVESVPLGRDSIDRAGLNAGFYEQAGADELCAYFSRVLQEHFLPTGRVQFFGCNDYVGAEGSVHRFVSRLNGDVHEVTVRKKLVDATYLEGQIPATSAPSFEVDDDVRCIPAGDVTRISDRPSRYVVIGGGKTSMDTCIWLLSNGVSAESICWVKPREGWWLNRRFFQPLTMLPLFYAGSALQMQAMAEATSIENLFLRLEAAGFLLRVDPSVMPEMLHGAISSDSEIALLRQIKDVVRMGRVRRLSNGRMELDGGEVATPNNTVFIHCAAQGLKQPPLRPIFEADRVTMQPTVWGFASQQMQLLGVAEALVESDDDKNRMCRPIHYWDRPTDFMKAFLALMASRQAFDAYPELATWARTSRLAPLSRLGDHRNDPTVAESTTRVQQFGTAAAQNLLKLLANNP